jgi:hypothetical protein
LSDVKDPTYLDSRLTDGGKVANPLYSPETFFFFLLLVLISVERLSEPQGLVRPEGLGKLEIHSPHGVSNPRHSGL